MWNIAKGLWVGVVIVRVLNLAVFMSRAAAPAKYRLQRKKIIPETARYGKDQRSVPDFA